MNVKYWTDSVRELGLLSTAHTMAYAALQRAVTYKALRGVVTEPGSLRYGADAGLPEGYHGSFSSEAQLRRLARDPASDLDDAFLDEALARGDRCYAVLEGDTLANYSWYSHRPRHIDERFDVHFDPRYVYVYKSLTPPAYRGRRLHGIAMSHALRALNALGYQGIIAHVESNNHRSLRSGARMGHREFGTIRMMHVGGRWQIWASPGCRRYGFHVEPRHATR